VNERLRAARGPVALRELKLRADQTQLTQRHIVRAFEDRLIAKRLLRTCVFAAIFVPKCRKSERCRDNYSKYFKKDARL